MKFVIRTRARKYKNTVHGRHGLKAISPTTRNTWKNDSDLCAKLMQPMQIACQSNSRQRRKSPLPSIRRMNYVIFFLIGRHKEIIEIKSKVSICSVFVLNSDAFELIGLLCRKQRIIWKLKSCFCDYFVQFLCFSSMPIWKARERKNRINFTLSSWANFCAAARYCTHYTQKKIAIRWNIRHQ